MFWTVYIKISFPSLQIQLACIYGCGIKDLGIVVPYVQQQELDTVDCDLIAIVNIAEICIGV